MGQRQTVVGIIAILVAVIIFGLVWGNELLPDMAWTSWLAAVLAFDIVAGAVANFTRGTNDFYAHRPVYRWGFIAIHIHLLIIGWSMGWDLGPVFLVWLATIACACVVNGTGNKPIIGCLCLAFGAMALPQLELEGIQLCLSALFFFKVTYSFAVNHYATQP